MQAMHVDVRRFEFDQGGVKLFRPQDRTQRQRFVAAQLSRNRRHVGQGGVGRQAFGLFGAGDVHRRARPHQRHLGEAGRRGKEEVVAGARQRAHGLGSVGRREQGGGPARRVVAGLALALEHEHAPVRRQMRGRRSARHARTDHQNVVLAGAQDPDPRIPCRPNQGSHILKKKNSCSSRKKPARHAAPQRPASCEATDDKEVRGAARRAGALTSFHGWIKAPPGSAGLR